MGLSFLPQRLIDTSKKASSYMLHNKSDGAGHLFSPTNISYWLVNDVLVSIIGNFKNLTVYCTEKLELLNYSMLPPCTCNLVDCTINKRFIKFYVPVFHTN